MGHHREVQLTRQKAIFVKTEFTFKYLIQKTIISNRHQTYLVASCLTSGEFPIILFPMMARPGLPVNLQDIILQLYLPLNDLKIHIQYA